MREEPRVLGVPQTEENLADMEAAAASTEAPVAGETQARIRELIKLAKEQGYLTFDDLNEALPADVTDPD
ncbi:MAG: hypothetical protein M3505_13175, partial [Verrucomicrobiota bacterium]|nr:hypothetical protein [Verrucomicrobiota bacterium]